LPFHQASIARNIEINTLQSMSSIS
jgi:hypothetical protein